MTGSTSPWDQSHDPRDNTVDLPRIDVDGLTAYLRRTAPIPAQEPVGRLEPLPEHKPGGRLEPLPDPEPGLAPSSPDGSESSSYSMPSFARSGGLRHPYAEPDEPRRAHAAPGEPVFPTGASGIPAALTPRASDRGAPSSEPPRGAPSPDPAAAPAPQQAAVRTPPPVAAPQLSAPPQLSVPPAEESKPAPAPGRRPAETGAQARPTVSRPAGRAPAGSLADLRSRLARLPDGHPSSPYEDDGYAKPPPTRIKQLELGLPAPGRDIAPGNAPEVEPAARQLDVTPDPTEPDVRDAAHRVREQAAPVTGKTDAGKTEAGKADAGKADAGKADAGKADAGKTEAGKARARETELGDTQRRAAAAPAAEAPDIRAADEAAAAAEPKSGARPGSSSGPPGWSDPYAEAGGGRVSDAPNPPADLALGPWRNTPIPRASGLGGLSRRGGNGHGPSNGPASPSPRSESRLYLDRPDPARGDAGRGDAAQHHRAFEPSIADLEELVDRTLAISRTAEGRNIVDGYGSSGLTPAMQRLAAHLPFGGLAPGSDVNSLKSRERFTAKLARLIARTPGRTAEELAATIGDAVRYAFAFEVADYAEGTWLVHRRLKSHGFELEVRRNRWESPEYKGIFTQWRDPAHHIAFEVQFHTTTSWAVMQRTHETFVQITDPSTPPAERSRLRAQLVSAAETAKVPANCAEIDDFRLEPR